MNQSVAVSNTQAVVGSFTQSELDTLKSTIARGTSNEQFALFVQTCSRSGLNPFLNQIYCIVYEGKNGPVMSIQIAVEGIVALAKKHPQYKGFIASEVKQNDEFEIDVVTGEPKHRITTMQRGETVGAYCVAYRDGAPNIAVVITRDQVEHLIKGRNGQMWKDYFDDMIVKHAIKRAFKRQFGIEVAEDEAIGSEATNIPEYEPQRKDITDEVNQPQKRLQERKPEPKTEDKPSEEDQIKKLRAEIKRKFVQLGITDQDAMQAYMEQNCKVKGEKPTAAELKALIKIMDMEIQQQAQHQDNDDLLD